MYVCGSMHCITCILTKSAWSRTYIRNLSWPIYFHRFPSHSFHLHFQIWSYVYSSSISFWTMLDYLSFGDISSCEALLLKSVNKYCQGKRSYYQCNYWISVFMLISEGIVNTFSILDSGSGSLKGVLSANPPVQTNIFLRSKENDLLLMALCVLSKQTSFLLLRTILVLCWR